MIQLITPREAATYLDDSYGEDREEIIRQLNNKIAAPYKIGEAVIVVRAEFPELVIMCAEGSRLDHAGFREFIKRVIQAEFKSIRFHTKKFGIPRLINIICRDICKFEESERVYRARVI